MFMELLQVFAPLCPCPDVKSSAIIISTTSLLLLLFIELYERYYRDGLDEMMEYFVTSIVSDNSHTSNLFASVDDGDDKKFLRKFVKTYEQR